MNISDTLDAPDVIPAYVVDGIDRQNRDTLRAIAHYASERADLLEEIEDQELDEDDLVDQDEELVDVVDQDDSAKGTIVEKKVSCGKDSCSTCPHGPYQYRAYRDGDTVKTDYIGPA